MLKKTITYVDYDGNQQTEDFYFNLTKAEITKLFMSPKGGLDTMLKKMVRETNTGKIVETIEKIILMSYGEKSFDGKRFIKEDPKTGRPLYKDFKESPAYSALFMEIIEGGDAAAAAFINGVIPQTVAEQINKERAIQAVAEPKLN